MKTWLITGANSGLGGALAEAAVAAGDTVVAVVRQAESMTALADRFPGQVMTFVCDFTDPTAPASVVEAAFVQAGSIDVVVSNAGAGLLAALEETTDADLDRIVAVNLTGPLRLFRAAIPLLRVQGRGHLVAVTAIATVANDAGFCVYGAAKAGLDAACHALAQEVAPFGLKVTVVAPGPFRTPFLARSMTLAPRKPGYEPTVGKFGALLQKIDGRQAGDPAKAAEAIRHAVSVERPPFRLVLGKYAHQKIEKALHTSASEVEAWRQVGAPTDH